MFYALLFFTLFLPLALHTAPAQNTTGKLLKEKLTPSSGQKKSGWMRRAEKKTISFYFDDEDLIDVINIVAGQKGVNIILPTGPQAINQKLTMHLEEKLSVQDAWDLLFTVLDLAGYSMVPDGQMYTIVKTSKEIVREPLPLYLGVAPDQLPNTDQRIRFLYYLTNIRVDQEGTGNELTTLLQTVLPETANVKTDPQTNGILITDKANNIRKAMEIIVALDQAEIKEQPEIIRLRHTDASQIAALFNDQILKTTGDRLRYDAKKLNEATFFSRTLKIVPEPRTNSIIILGRPQAVERVKDFIDKYIDVEPESGKSILHVYELQYLDAYQFAPVLQKIVESSRTGGTDQSKAGSLQIGGTERFFDEVIIKADRPETASGEKAQGVALGSNNLIIAARNDDWEHIKKLIEDLDTPQPQVIIEVLIADLTLDDIRLLGSAIRNAADLSMPPHINFQSAQIQQVLTDSVMDPTTIQADLLRRAFDTSGSQTANCDGINPPADDCVASVKFFNPGSTVFSFNDKNGETWGVLQIRKFFSNKKVLSHPHVIATNNKEAVISLKEERLVPDEASGSTGGTTTATRKWIPAVLEVRITPRISSNDTVNLTVLVNIDQFNSATNFANADRITRKVATNANVPSKSILALGGLSRLDTSNSAAQTPFLSQIPILGWFFKARQSSANQNNLTVFISPTILQPRLRSGAGVHTREQVDIALAYAREGALFDNLRDPVTRWFFRSEASEMAQKQFTNFIGVDEFQSIEGLEPGDTLADGTVDEVLETRRAQTERLKVLLEQTDEIQDVQA